MIKINVILMLIALILYPLPFKTALGAEETGERPPDEISGPWSEGAGLGKEIADGFAWRFNTLGFGVVREPETESLLNFDNRQNITRYQAELDVRPDFELEFRRVNLSVKPRLEIKGEKWTEGLKEGAEESDVDAFVNEWQARLMVTDELFLSYGRENLQWGPSYLISPSNPFNKDNGRDNPKIEVAGLDYGRLVWIPSYNWTASLIANTDEGRADFFEEFERTYALKIDYTGYEKYFTLIPSHRESEESNLGFFAGWSLSDALLIYGEGNINLDESENDSGDPDFLAGTSYTLEMGPTIALEYYYHGNGVTGPIHEALPPLGDANPDDILFRENYAMLQVSDSHIRDAFNIILRWIQGLDECSSRSIGIFEYEMGDHLKLFAIGDYFTGDTDTEFGSVQNYSFFAGVELTY